jgi:hypothetical protein
MKVNALAWALIGVLASCKAESASKHTDSATASASADSFASRRAQASYADLAGDTLRLITTRGAPLPQIGQRLPCRPGAVSLPAMIVMAADSSYWAVAGEQLPCRDTVNPSSDSSQYRGGYRVFGDSLFLHPADMFLDSTFIGRIFPDSVVELGVASANARRYLRRHGVSSDPALLGHPSTDTLFLLRDIDGSGKPDYVVRESRVGRDISMKDYRLAVYLDSEPGSRTPDWASSWDAEIGSEPGMNEALTIAPGVSLVHLSWDYADAGGDDVLIVEHGKVRPEMSHTIDYGHGIFTITQPAGKTVIEATLSNLKLAGVEVTDDANCQGAEMGAMKLVFDVKSGHFTRGKPYCVNPQ